MKKHPEAFLLRYCLRRANEESGAISNSRHICPTEKTKKDGYVHRNCPFCPFKKAEAVNCRSEARPYPRRAQSTFDGSAVESAFALLLAKVTKLPAGLKRRMHLTGYLHGLLAGNSFLRKMPLKTSVHAAISGEKERIECRKTQSA